MKTATLITNIRMVVINDVRIFAHALLLEEETEDSPARLRGFLTKGTLPVFELSLDGADNTGVALELHGARTELVIGSRSRVMLTRHNPKAPIDLQPFEIDEHNEVYAAVWGELAEKVLHYWPLAHLVPVTTFLPLQ